MKKILLLLLLINSLFASGSWQMANKECLKNKKRLPTIIELVKIKNILTPGLYWSATPLKDSNNYEYWILKIDEDKKFFKGILPKNTHINFNCIKSKIEVVPTEKQILDRKKAFHTFRAIYKDKVITFPRGYLSFMGKPWHSLDSTIAPYNFYHFKIKLSKPISHKNMKTLIGKIVSYDTILFGRILNVSSIEGSFTEYSILSTPTDLLEPYILPDEAITGSF